MASSSAASSAAASLMAASLMAPPGSGPRRLDAASAARAPRAQLATLADLNALVVRAAADGDATLFLRGGAVPALKVTGIVRWLDEFEPVAPGDLERLLAELAAEPTPAAGTDPVLRWMADGALVACRVTVPASPSETGAPPVEAALTIASTQPASAERLGLPPALVATCRDDFGLVLVTGADGHAVSRTCHSLIDAVNRDRAHHIIVLEPEAVIAHPRRSGFLSHRLVARGDETAWMQAVERAIAEEPDLLAVDGVPSGRVLERLLEYSAGALVIVTRIAPSAIAAIDGLAADLPARDRATALARVARSMAAAVGQREIARRGGGAASSAYELVAGTPGVRALIAQGAFDALALALERRVDGMISMAVAVSDLLRQGRITARQASAAVPGLAAAVAEPAGPIDRDLRGVDLHGVDLHGADLCGVEPIGDPVDLSEMLASIAESA